MTDKPKPTIELKPASYQPSKHQYDEDFPPINDTPENIARAHEAVCHSVGEYVNGMAHTNGMESFWATLKRGYHGTFHHFSEKHMGLYVGEFAGRHNTRRLDTIDMMKTVAGNLVGKRLRYRELVT